MTSKVTLTPKAHQVTLAGRVVIGLRKAPEESIEPTGINVPGAIVDILAGPPKLEQQLALKSLSHGAAWSGLKRRLNRTQSAGDGSFFFLDLPPGDYTLQARLPSSGSRYGATDKVIVSVPSETEPSKPVWQELVLSATGIIGQVHNGQETPKGLVMAKVQIAESGEVVYCNNEGKFELLGLEAAVTTEKVRQVTLHISASGYKSYTLTEKIRSGVITEISVPLSKPNP